MIFGLCIKFLRGKKYSFTQQFKKIVPKELKCCNIIHLWAHDLIFLTKNINFGIFFIFNTFFVELRVGGGGGVQI